MTKTKTQTNGLNPHIRQIIDGNARHRVEVCLCDNCQKRRAASFLSALSVLQGIHGMAQYSFVRKAQEVQAVTAMERAGGVYLSHQVFSGTYFIHIGEFADIPQYTKPVPAFQELAILVAVWQKSGALWEMGTGFMGSLISRGEGNE